MTLEALTGNSHPLLDVRSLEDFRQRHVRGSSQIPWPALKERMHELPASHQPLNVLSDADAESEVQQFLTGKGYQVEKILVSSDALWAQIEQMSLSESGQSCIPLWRANPLLIENIGTIESLTEGRRALDLAAGAGRDAVFLAKRGWNVMAVDIKQDALNRVLDLATQNEVSEKIDTLKLDLEAGTERLPFEAESYDLIIVMRYLYRPLLPKLSSLLKDEGLLFYSTFMEGSEKFGSPRNPNYLLRKGELAETYSGLTIIKDHIHHLPDGRPVASFLAQKPKGN